MRQLFSNLQIYEMHVEFVNYKKLIKVLKIFMINILKNQNISKYTENTKII